MKDYLTYLMTSMLPISPPHSKDVGEYKKPPRTKKELHRRKRRSLAKKQKKK